MTETRWGFGIGINELVDGFTALTIGIEFDVDSGVDFYVTIFKYMFWVGFGTFADDDEE